jgi:hypothetical protein
MKKKIIIPHNTDLNELIRLRRLSESPLKFDNSTLKFDSSLYLLLPNSLKNF